jgi:sugar phosphate isomerase/epimerase
MNQGNMSRLCIHTVTTKPWDIDTAIAEYAKAGVSGITVWRDALEQRDPATVGETIRKEGMTVAGLCRGGFFAHADKGERRKALEENYRAVEEAAAIGAPVLVLVCGADGGQDLAESRLQIAEAVSTLAEKAEANDVRLAVEPLHPMYADSRSAINTLKQANDLCEKAASQYVGVAVDVYHLWWDPELETELERCGRMGKIFAFHVCDWKVPTSDMLLDRGLMGEGCIPIKKIRSWVEAAGFTGFNEVEIFSRHYWAQEQKEFLKKIVAAYQQYV